eukprot:Stramenopile-MAST_4_protein_5314
MLRKTLLYKTTFCSAWLGNEKCEFGAGCLFAHGEEELETTQGNIERVRKSMVLASQEEKARAEGKLLTTPSRNAPACPPLLPRQIASPQSIASLYDQGNDLLYDGHDNRRSWSPKHPPAPWTHPKVVRVTANASKTGFMDLLEKCEDAAASMPEAEAMEGDAAAVAADMHQFNHVEDILEEWTIKIKGIIARQARAVPTEKGPMAEVEFWRNQNASLSALYEQIHSDCPKKMVSILTQNGGSTVVDEYLSCANELNRLYIEAADNIKFLSTLERHFKNISGGNLSIIYDALPSVMNGLKLVWVISRHFYTDERMVRLMKRIADEIGDAVSARIDVFKILKSRLSTAKSTIELAKSVLDHWRASYFKTRGDIEKAATHHRWEFDKKILFERTDYMASVCDDMLYVVNGLMQFRMFLGPDLREVTGEGDMIDDVMNQVDNLVVPLETMPFDVFDRNCRASWLALMAQFKEREAVIDHLCRTFLDTAFDQLRSADGAFEVLQRFENMQSRKSLQAQVTEKYDNVLIRYGEEVDLC